MAKNEFEVCANDWYEASREIVRTYTKYLAGPEYDENSFDTPTRFSMMMQTDIMFHYGLIKENEMLKKEIEELYSEIDKLKNK